MSYKCVMCGQPIGKKDGEWGMEFSLTKWMHYKCIEHLWDAYSSMKQPTPEGLSQLTNKELAEKLISDVWGLMKLFGEKSDLLAEAIERLFVLDIPNKVYCTADGEYPEHCQFIEIQSVFLYRGAGIFLAERDGIKNVFRIGSGDIHTHEDNAPIYWKPLTSLKDEYERQKDGE